MSASKAAADEWQFRDFEGAAALFGLSHDAVKALAAQKTFPVFAKKICPALMREWLSENRDRLREIKVG